VNRSITLPLVLLTLLLLSARQAAFAAQQDASGPAIPLDYLPALKGDYFRHESKNVGRPFHIYVAFPESYTAQPLARYRRCTCSMATPRFRFSRPITCF